MALARFDTFVLVTACVPSAGQGLVHVEYQQRRDEVFLKFLKGATSRMLLVQYRNMKKLTFKTPRETKRMLTSFQKSGETLGNCCTLCH